MANPIAFLCHFFILLPSFIYPVLSICYFILILEHFSAFHYPLKSSVNLSFFYHFIYLFIYLFQQEHSIFPVHSRKPGVGKHPFPRRLMFPAHLNQRNVYSAVKQIFAIRFMACGKANIHNPSLQLCWQGLASLLAHERSRFATCVQKIRQDAKPDHPACYYAISYCKVKRIFTIHLAACRITRNLPASGSLLMICHNRIAASQLIRSGLYHS